MAKRINVKLLVLWKVAGKRGVNSHQRRSNLSAETVVQRAANVFTRWVICDSQAESICQQFVTWINEDLDNLMTG